MSPTKVEAACADAPLAVFYEDLWEASYTLALTEARDVYCDNCPVRKACLKQACELEKGETAENRAGIFAGFTPQQRHALGKRGQSLSCAECGQAYDPTELRTGTLRCRCGKRDIAPIPDRGDQWTPRHTKLARMTISWLSEHVEVGGDVPAPLALSRQLKVGVKDLRRVYRALVEDHVLLKDDDEGYRRRKSAASAKRWTPPHLRVDLSHGE
jgi:hypothetical protein